MVTIRSHGPQLPQLHGRPMVTDGGMETDLIFHHGVDLPCFAAFPLVEADAGRALLEAYYDGYAAVARRAGAGLMLESATWRANPDWGERLGYGPADLERVNTASIAMLARLRERYATTITDVIISGMVGGANASSECVTTPRPRVMPSSTKPPTSTRAIPGYSPRCTSG